MIGAMGIDLEDYYHASIFDNIIPFNNRDSLPSYVQIGTSRILEILEKYNIKSTFFCLGEVAVKNPKIIKEIFAAGHEIAAHSMHHKRIFNMTSSEFLQDTKNVKNILGDIIGKQIIGYRAPSFSINDKTDFFYKILLELGFKYSSSINPIRHDHYGNVNAPVSVFQPILESDFLEIPVSVLKIFNHRLALGGGGWFRLMPYFIYKNLANIVSTQRPLIFYTHPWEFVPEQPKIHALNFKKKFRHYYNISANYNKFDKLCADFTWNSFENIYCLNA